MSKINKVNKIIQIYILIKIRLVQKSVMLLVEVAERRGRGNYVGSIAKKHRKSV